MPRPFLIALIVVLLVQPVIYAQKKADTFRIQYFEHYDLKSNQFTDELNQEAIQSASQYYKVYLTVKGKRVKAEKYENNRMSLYYLFDKNEEMVYSLSHMYDDQGRITRIERINKESKLYSYQTFHYDKENKRLMTVKEFTPNGRIFGERKYSYDKGNKPSKVSVYVGSKLLYVRTFSYDPYGDQILGELIFVPSKIDLSNSDHIIWLYSMILGDPDNAEAMLAKYGVESSEDVETFYTNLAELADQPDFEERLKAMLELRDTYGRGGINILDVEPTVEPFDSPKRIIGFEKEAFIKKLDSLTDSIDQIVIRYNDLEVNQTEEYHKSMSHFAIKMKTFQFIMNRTKFNQSNRSILDYYTRNYPMALRHFLASIQEAGEMYKRKEPLDFTHAPFIQRFNDEINQFINTHNRLVDQVNNLG